MSNTAIQVSKRAFTWTVVALTIMATFLPMFSVVHAAPNASANDVVAGDYIRLDGQNAVHYINDDMKRAFLPFDWTFFTYLPSFADANIKVLPSGTDLDELFPQATPPLVGPNAGTTLLSSSETARVYAMGCGGTLHQLTDVDAITALYGSSFDFRDLPGFLLSLFPQGDAIDGSVPHCGQLVRETAGGSVYRVNESGQYEMVDGSVPTALANRVLTMSASQKSGLTKASTSVAASSLTIPVGGVAPSEGGNETPAPQGAIQVSLAATTPEPSNVVTNVDRVVFTELKVKNTSNADVTVNSFRISRNGLGATSDFTSVTLYSEGKKVGLTRTSWTNDGYMNYNVAEGFKVSANSSRNLQITARLATAGTYNALGVSAMTVTGGTVSGLPVKGSEMSGVSVSVGTVTITGQGTATQSKNIGTNGVTLAHFRLAVSSVEDGMLKTVTLKNKGTASDGDVVNLTLYNGSTKLAGPVSMESDEVVFNLSESFEILKSKNADFKVFGDIVDGLGNNVEFVLNNTADLIVEGKQYKTPMSVTSSGYDATSDSGTTLTTVTGAQLNVAYSGQNLETADDRLNVNFGTLTFGSGSTDVKISGLVLGIDENDGDGDVTNNKDVDEFELHGSDGTILSGTMGGGGDTNANGESWTFSDEVYISAGQSITFTMYGDLPTGIGDQDSYSVTGTLNSTNITAETQPAGDTVSNFSVGSIDGRTVTVSSPKVTIRSTDMNSGDPVINEADVVIYKGTIQAGAAGVVTIDRMRFEGALTAAGDVTVSTTLMDVDNWNQIGLYVDGVEQDLLTSGELTDGELDFNTLSFDVNAGETVNFEVKGNLKNVFSANNIVHLQLDTVSARDTDGDTATVVNSAGTAIASGSELEIVRTLTLRDKGILYVTMRNNDSGFNRDRIVLAGEGAWVGKIRLRADYEGVKLKDLKLTNGSADDEDSVATQGVCIYNAAQVSASNLVACTSLDTNDVAFFDDINVELAKGTHDWYVYVQTNNIGNSSIATADTKDLFRFQIATTASNVVVDGLRSNSAYAFGDQDSSAEVGEIVLDYDMNGTFDEAGVDIYTTSTRYFDVAGSKITDVDLVDSYGGRTRDTSIPSASQTYNLAIIKIETKTHSNADANGNALIMGVGSFILDVQKTYGLVLSAATIQRIGSSAAPAALTITAVDGLGETSGDWTLPNATGTMGVDAQIDAGDTAYFLVRGTVSAVSSTANVTDSITVSLDTLGSRDDGNSATNNIDWFDGYDTSYATANDFDYLNLDKISVDGDAISEPAS